MKKSNYRYFFAAFPILGSAVLTTTIIRCEPAAPPAKAFSYLPHERPRLFVTHQPLRALPGHEVTVKIVPDLGPDDGAVIKAVANLHPIGSSQSNEKTCDSNGDGTFTCTFNLPEGEADYIYNAYIVLPKQSRVATRKVTTRRVTTLASYRFTATDQLGSNRLVTLREPVIDSGTLPTSYRMDTAWVRDQVRGSATTGGNYTEDQFLTDIETAVYEGILADPVYRWRDDQLAFYVYSDPGFTSSYYSGFDTRCGQNPWPSESNFRSAFHEMEVLAVLHRHNGTIGLEGTVTDDPPPTSNTFRDCAGFAVKQTGLSTFSVTGGSIQTRRIAKHEFGHAAFGLGDEYTESETTRHVPAAQTSLLNSDPNCCCRSENGGRTTGQTDGSGPGQVPGIGESGAVQCIQPGGGLKTVPGLSSSELPTCADPPTFQIFCGATPQEICPTLSGHCVKAEMWLGTPPSDTVDTARPNTFATHDLCEAGRAAASVHPGVEDVSRGLGECRELCGPTTAPCPCNQAEAWIVDINPSDVVARPPRHTTRPDSMAEINAERDGSTCAWCVETSLCVRWERARGQTTDDAWSHCNAPPQDAIKREHESATLARAISNWVQKVTKELTRNWHF